MAVLFSILTESGSALCVVLVNKAVSVLIVIKQIVNLFVGHP